MLLVCSECEPVTLNRFKWLTNHIPTLRYQADYADAFCTTFDLSRRISPRALQKARAEDVLHVMDLDDGTFAYSGENVNQNSFEQAWSRIEALANELRARKDAK